jgi:two-component system, OmpR family, phosphate regulon response regulator PhoB
MARILEIDDDLGSHARVARFLEPRGHRIIVATTASEGVRLARAKRPGVVLLAQRLPDRSGIDVCKILKGDPATGRIPIVILLDRPDPIERAVACELGAADLVKPFTLEELVARVEGSFVEPARDPATDAQRFGSLTVGSAGREVSVAGRRVDLTPVELALLLVLCEGGERVYTRAELRERVWGEEGRDETRAVDQYVKRLRKKLGKAGLYIETVHGVGYRFAKTRAEHEDGES